jgi:CP family cyanate transporter-like MFS transporter
MRPAWLVVAAGMVAALHVGKIPPALPALQHQMGLSLVASGFLLSMVQLAGLLLAVVLGLMSDGFGQRRTLLTGLCLIGAASALGGWADSVAILLLGRALEGLGFLLVVLPAPGLIRRVVAAHQLSGMMGLWGTYMPTGTAVAMLLGPVFIPRWGWSYWWGLFAVLSWLMALVIWRNVPPDPAQGAMHQTKPWGRLLQTLGAGGPWLVALTFAVYSGQWMAVIGFLPSIYAAAGVTGSLLGALSALAAAMNIVGNVFSGRLIQRGWSARSNLWLGFAAMALGSSLAYLPMTAESPWLRYAGVLLFSAMGGLVPGTLFYLAVRLAPGEQHIATTVGWAQQLSAMGQFFGAPAVAALAAYAGGWQLTPLFTLSCCALGAYLAWLAQRVLQARAAQSGHG